MTNLNETNFEFKPKNAKPVYTVLAQHQAMEQDWELHGLLRWLQLWSDRMISEFALDLSEISLCVDWLPRGRLGHFRYGHNGFGLSGEVAINRAHLCRQEPWQLLGTLFHELLHAWQSAHGKPGRNNYHNKQFRETARHYGLIVDTRGCTQFEPRSRFFRFLAKYGVEEPDVPSVRPFPRGNSKLKKWSCRCTPPINVRVAVPHFRARCLRCDSIFEPSD